MLLMGSPTRPTRNTKVMEGRNGKTVYTKNLIIRNNFLITLLSCFKCIIRNTFLEERDSKGIGLNERS